MATRLLVRKKGRDAPTAPGAAELLATVRCREVLGILHCHCCSVNGGQGHVKWRGSGVDMRARLPVARG